MTMDIIERLQQLGYNKEDIEKLNNSCEAAYKDTLDKLFEIAAAKNNDDIGRICKTVREPVVMKALGYYIYTEFDSVPVNLVVADAVVRANIWLVRSLKLMKDLDAPSAPVEDAEKEFLSCELTTTEDACMQIKRGDEVTGLNINKGNDNIIKSIELLVEMCNDLQKKYKAMDKNSRIRELEHLQEKINQTGAMFIDQPLLSDENRNYCSLVEKLPVGKLLTALRGVKMHSLCYYLFDNSMGDMIFSGTGYKHLWKYQTPDTANLYRAVGTSKFVTDVALDGVDKEYYRNMLGACVDHMNKGNQKGNKLASWSKNIMRDINKYLAIKSNDEEYEFVLSLDGESKPRVEFFRKGNGAYSSEDDAVYTKNTVTFSMVKNARTNVIRDITPAEETDTPDFTISSDGGNAEKKGYLVSPPRAGYQNFFDFRYGCEEDAAADYAFCIDILNNKADYSGDVRNVFNKYTKYGLQLSIVASSDAEVIMLGSTCDGRVQVGAEDIRYNNCDENVEYCCELGIKEMIVLYGCINILRQGKNVNTTEELLDNNNIAPFIVRYDTLGNIKRSKPETEDERFKSLNLRNLLEKAIMSYYAAIHKEVISNDISVRKLKLILDFLLEEYKRNQYIVYDRSQKYNNGSWDKIQDCWYSILL